MNAFDALAPMPRRLIEAARLKGYVVHVSHKRTAGRLPVVMVAISGKPRVPFGQAIDDLERLAGVTLT